MIQTLIELTENEVPITLSSLQLLSGYKDKETPL